MSEVLGQRSSCEHRRLQGSLGASQESAGKDRQQRLGKNKMENSNHEKKRQKRNEK